MPDRVGQQIGNYRLVKLLGKGGFAEVYLGQHVRLAAKQAAIKILHLTDVDARKFQEEAETTEKLVHPHIVRLLDFDIEEGTPFLVLDYAPGGSLRTRHPKGSVVPLASVGEYLKEIAPTLQYAHDLHILHRDIKPDNVLIGRGEELLLSDFGIAVLTQTGRTSLSSAYGIGGTPYYMAPETYRGRPVKESDQYALAVVVYEWLCGSVPFSQGDFIQLGFQHATEPVPPLREKNPAIAIPPEVEAVIRKALSKEPKDRFASVQTFVQAFEQSCIPTRSAEQPKPGQSKSGKQTPPEQSSGQTRQKEKGQPSQRSGAQTPQPGQDGTGVKDTNRSVPPGDTPTGRTEQPQTPGEPKTSVPPPPEVSSSPGTSAPTAVVVPTRRITRRTMLFLGLAGAGVTVTGIGWWLLSPHPLYTYRGHTDAVFSVAWSPDGKYIASGSDDKTVQVWDPSTGQTLLTYRGHTFSYVFSVVWSPDDKYIASGSADDTVQVWDASTGNKRLTYTEPYTGNTSDVHSVAWSPDGKKIASGSDDKTVRVWDTMSGNTHLTYTGHSGMVNSVAWSPDGKEIASGSSEDNTVQVWDAVTGTKHLTYTGHTDAVFSVAWSPDGKEIASGSHDKTVQVWDVVTGTKHLTYTGHTDAVNSVAWSPDGKEIVSGSQDTTVQVWDAMTGTKRVTYTGLSGPVFSVAWSPDGKEIASGSHDTTVQVWQAV